MGGGRGAARRDRRPQRKGRAARARTRAARPGRGARRIHRSGPAYGGVFRERRQGRRARGPRARRDPAQGAGGGAACRPRQAGCRQTTGAMSILRAENLRKRYKARTGGQGASLEVASGEVVGLLGPNGAGKTTCFYMIVGLVPADAGRIRLDGRDLTQLPIHRRARLGISYLPQENSVFRKLTVEENVQAVLELQGLPPAQVETRLAELLAELNIGHLRKHPAHALSGGERRRLEIARALGTQPLFILLD